MRALIITDETGSKLPQVDSLNNKIGKGSDVSKYTPILKILEEKLLPIPSTNFELEEEYKSILSDFIRPANLMFGGLFNEVRGFHYRMKDIIPTDLMIITSRYGLISEKDLIIPYRSESFTADSVPLVDSKAHFFTNIVSIQNQYDFLIILLSSPILRYILKNNWLQTLPSEQKKYCVTGDSLHRELSEVPNLLLFTKKGVSRIGSKNSTEILNHMKRILSE